MTQYPSATSDKMMLRLPDGWRDAIKVMAAKRRRSMNSEILEMIEPTVLKELEEQNAPT